MSSFEIISSSVQLNEINMPERSKRRSHFKSAAARRWSTTIISDFDDSSSDEYSMGIDDEVSTFSESLLITDVGDLAEMCKSKRICSFTYQLKF